MDLGRKHRTVLPAACTISRISQLIWSPEPWHLIVLCVWFIFWMCFRSQLLRCGCSIIPHTKCLLQLIAIREIHTPSLSAFLPAVTPCSALHMILKVMWYLLWSWAVFWIPWLHTGILSSAPSAALERPNSFFFRKQQSKSGLLGFFFQVVGE